MTRSQTIPLSLILNVPPERFRGLDPLSRDCLERMSLAPAALTLGIQAAFLSFASRYYGSFATHKDEPNQDLVQFVNSA